MATLTFLTPEGEERSWRLDPRSPLRIGRDADNDVVLRDPRVSRHHARVVHEKGFFVVYDLSSANGTFVQGKRVQVAPLVNGSEVRMGNSIGRFRDDPPARPEGTVVDQRIEDIGTPAEDPAPSQTRPFPKPDAAERSAEATGDATAVADSSHYAIEFGDGSPSVVKRGEDPLFFFRRPPRLVAWVASLIAAMVAATGVTAVIVLALLDRTLPALLAALLTLVFFTLIVLATPRRELVIYRDEALTDVGFVVRQATRLPFPVTEYRAEEAEGRFLARFRKNYGSNFGRRRWWIVDENGSPMGWAEEDSLRSVMARKVAGHAIRALRSNYRFVIGGRFVGHIERREGSNLIDLSADQERHFDRRLAIPLSALILSIEGR